MAYRPVGGLPALSWGFSLQAKGLLPVGDARRCTMECRF